MNEYGFKYVLLGKMQSDNIESRFARIRQLSGANHCISMRQLLESDRKLRTLSSVKYSKISIKQIEEAAKTRPAAAHDVILKAESLYRNLCLSILPSEIDVVVMFYVTGYCCRSLAKSNRCEKCREVQLQKLIRTRMWTLRRDCLQNQIKVASENLLQKCLILAVCAGGFFQNYAIVA